jgi:hypothetical protein
MVNYYDNKLNNLTSEVFGQLIISLYMPNFQKSKLLQKYGHIRLVDLDSLFKGSKVKTVEAAIEYLEEIVKLKFEPGSEMAKTAIDHSDFLSGQLTTEEYKMSYSELLQQIRQLLGKIDLVTAKLLLSEFKNYLEINDEETPTIKEIILELSKILSKKQLLKIINLIS